MQPLHRNILLVEDNPVDARLIEIYLQDDQIIFDTEKFDQLEPAKRFIEKNFVDVILLDLSLPDSRGLQTFLTLKNIAPWLPILILTGLDDRELANEAVRSGAQDYLVKGKFDGIILKQAIRYAIERKKTERTIRESEERYRDLVEKADIAIVTADINGSFKFFNNRFWELFGFSSKEMHRQSFFSLIFSPDVENMRQFYLDRLNGRGLSTRHEFRGIRKDGSLISLEIEIQPVLNNGKVIGSRSYIWDITERKNSEKALIEQNIYNKIRADILRSATEPWRTSEAALIQQLLESIGPEMDLSRAVYFCYNPEQRAYQVNQRWVREDTPDVPDKAVPYEIAEFFFGRKSVTLPDDIDTIFPGTKLKQKMQKLVNESLKQFNVESTLFVPHGSVSNPDGFFAFSTGTLKKSWHQINKTVFIEVINTVAIALAKITAEREVSRLASVVQQASESIVITDKKGRIEYVNPSFEESTGYSFTEVQGQNPRLLKSNLQDDVFYKNLWETISSGNTWQGTFANRKKDGGLYYEDAVIFPVKNAKGNIINYAAVKRDVTRERKLAEQLQQAQKLEGIGQLAGGIAHDFNNILSVINGFSELSLLAIDPDHPIYNKLKQISEAGMRANNLVRQLLAFSRKQIIKPKIVEVNELIIGLEKMLHRLIGEDISMQLLLGKDIGFIKADPGQFEQIMINLIVNARDAINVHNTSASKKKITIQTKKVCIDDDYISEHPGSRAGDCIRVIVSDSGVGMDEQTQHKIFEPFFTTKPEGEGTGMGLSTVYGIVKQNGGTIYVESEPEKGATFEINWPSRSGAEIADPGSLSENKIVGGKETILLAEDEEAVRAFASESLDSLGYKVLQAANGIDALKIVQDNGKKIQLVISDVVMPEMGGKELIDRINELLPDVKVIFASGYTDSHIVHSGVLKNGVNFIQKPYSIQKLAKKVRDVLDQTENLKGAI